MNAELDIHIVGLKNLIRVVKETYNFDFSDYAISSFKRRVERVIMLYNVKNVDELTEKIKASKHICYDFVKEITVNTTEMFRDPSFWRKLKEDVIPNLATHNNIRIWHAACSSGEEVYSMAILLKEMGLLDRAIIHATDLNDDVIATAKSGTYSLRSMELNQSNYERAGGKGKLDDYYVASKDRVTFDPELVKNVSFKVHDLAKDTLFSKFDLILCRNVMIYFNIALQDKVVAMFNEGLFSNGFLAIGSKETIAWCRSAEGYTTYCSDEKIYRKK
jgi:chemotaxis protein methyltransferase CheR